jgi:hypothetical protein
MTCLAPRLPRTPDPTPTHCLAALAAALFHT